MTRVQRRLAIGPRTARSRPSMRPPPSVQRVPPAEKPIVLPPGRIDFSSLRAAACGRNTFTPRVLRAHFTDTDVFRSKVPSTLLRAVCFCTASEILRDSLEWKKEIFKLKNFRQNLQLIDERTDITI